MYLAHSVVGIRDLEVWLTLIYTWCRLLSVTWRYLKYVVIDYFTTTAVHHSFWGGTCICSPIFILYKELFCWSTFRSFQDVILTYSKGISPSRTSIGSTKCDLFCWGNKLHDELLFGGGREILSSTKRKAIQYALLYLVHMIAVCSVVGRIAAIVLYMYCLTGTKMHEIAFGHYLIAYSCWCCMGGHRSRTIIGATWVRDRYSRQMQLVW